MKTGLQQAGLMLAVLLGAAFPARAEIAIGPDFQGTLFVTAPSGDVQLFSAGEKLPPISVDSVVEIFGGELSLTTGAGDTVSVSCLGNTVVLGGGASVTLACGADSGLLRVTKGPGVLRDPAGYEIQLEDGKEYILKSLEEKPAPPVAAGTEPGTPIGRDSEPDSRSIQSSPSTG